MITVCNNLYDCDCSVDVRYCVSRNLSRINDGFVDVSVNVRGHRSCFCRVCRCGSTEYVSVRKGHDVNVRNLLRSLYDYHRYIASWFTISTISQSSRGLARYLANITLCAPPESHDEIVVPYVALFKGALVFCGRVWPGMLNERNIVSEMISLGVELRTVCDLVKQAVGRSLKAESNHGE